MMEDVVRDPEGDLLAVAFASVATMMEVASLAVLERNYARAGDSLRLAAANVTFLESAVTALRWPKTS